MAPPTSRAWHRTFVRSPLSIPTRRSCSSWRPSTPTLDADVVGTLQLSFLPRLARRGALRGQIEAVRVHGSYRGRGLGAAMITWAIDEGRRRGCALMQLTTDKSRVDAHRFYLRLGFVASHEGLKLSL